MLPQFPQKEANFISVSLSTDACTAGESPGSPDNTVNEVISAHSLDHDNTLYKLVNAYTNVSAKFILSSNDSLGSLLTTNLAVSTLHTRDAPDQIQPKTLKNLNG